MSPNFGYYDGMYHVSLPEEISNIVLNPIVGTGQSIVNSWIIDQNGYSQTIDLSPSGYSVTLNTGETHIFFSVMAADGMTTGLTEVVVTRTPVML